MSRRRSSNKRAEISSPGNAMVHETNKNGTIHCKATIDVKHENSGDFQIYIYIFEVSVKA